MGDPLRHFRGALKTQVRHYTASAVGFRFGFSNENPATKLHFLNFLINATSTLTEAEVAEFERTGERSQSRQDFVKTFVDNKKNEWAKQTYATEAKQRWAIDVVSAGGFATFLNSQIKLIYSVAPLVATASVASGEPVGSCKEAGVSSGSSASSASSAFYSAAAVVVAVPVGSASGGLPMASAVVQKRPGDK